MRIQGVDSDSACALTETLCPSDEFDEETCYTSQQSTTTSSCSISAECAESTDLGEGVIGKRLYYSSASCGALPSGQASCRCDNGKGQIAFDLEGTVASSSEPVLKACEDLDALKLDGPIECKRLEQSATRDYCGSTVECTETGSLAELTLTARAFVSTACNRVNDDGGAVAPEGASKRKRRSRAAKILGQTAAPRRTSVASSSMSSSQREATPRSS